MKRKLFLALFVLIMSIGLIACKAEKTDEIAEGSNEEVEEAQLSDAVSETVSEEETEQTMPEAESVEEVKEETKISWYMDEEGLKNEDIGVVIKRDNGIFEKIELLENVGIYTPSETGMGGTTRQNVFKCSYYDGEFDTYISEKGMEKGTVNGVDYAYKESEYDVEIAIAGNGIVIYSSFYTSDFEDGENVNDYLGRIDFIKPCDNFSKDCLAYITEDGLYCPVLGISLSCAGTEHCMNVISVSCAKNDYTATISMNDESFEGMGTMFYLVDTNNAQEVVDKYVEETVQPAQDGMREIVAIDGTVEVKIGRCNYLGRGVVLDYDGTNVDWWLFYSDDTTWSIDCDYDEQDGISYENYLAVFETLEQPYIFHKI